MATAPLAVACVEDEFAVAWVGVHDCAAAALVDRGSVDRRVLRVDRRLVPLLDQALQHWRCRLLSRSTMGRSVNLKETSSAVLMGAADLFT